MGAGQRFKLGAGAGLVTMLLGAVMVLAPVASAANDAGQTGNPPGNNGTVKIDGVHELDGPGHGPGPNDPGQHPDNDPHVECAFELEFFGFDEGQTADIVFTSHAPTKGGPDPLLSQEKVRISDDAAGPVGGENPDRDAVLTYDLTEQLGSIDPHPEHGWHVKLALTLYNSDGTAVPGGKKHKVFWIEGCQPTGTISVDKVVTGDGAPSPERSYGFTVSCLDGTDPVDLNGDEPEEDIAFALTPSADPWMSIEIPVGAECTITETDVQGASTTTMTVGDVALADDGATADPDGTVTVSSTNTAVLVTNDHPDVTPDTGTLSVDKVVTGDGAPSPERSYGFTVSCLDGTDPVDLNGDEPEEDIAFALTPSADPWMSIEIPVGAECTITETDVQGASTTTMTVGDVALADDGATADPDGTVTLSSTNTPVVVTNHYPGVQVIDTTTPLSYSIEVDKRNDADRSGLFRDSETAEEPGDDVAFQVTVTNNGEGPLVVQSLTDSVPGRGTIDLLGDDVEIVCTGAVPDLRVGSTLPVGSVTVCTFELDDYAPNAGDSLVNTVRVMTDRASDADSSRVRTEEADVVVLPTPPVEKPPAVTPPAVTPPVLVPPAVAPPQVLPVAVPEVRGDVVRRAALPRTGRDTGTVAGMGAFLIALGAAMVLVSKRQLARR